MPKFSKISKEKLATCTQPLQDLFNEVIKHWDCTIIEGHRGEEAQNKAYAEGKSQLKWPKGNHNTNPSTAVDVMPVKYIGNKMIIDWQDLAELKQFIGFVKSMAKHMKIEVINGGDWPKFKDYPHWELVKERNDRFK